MSIDAVVNGTAETLVSIMKTNDLSSLFNLPVEEMAKVMEIGSMEETNDKNSDLIDGSKSNSETVDNNRSATSNKKKESKSKNKKKKTSVHNAEAVEKSTEEREISSEVMSQEEHQKSLIVEHNQSSGKQIDESGVASESIVDVKLANEIKKKDSKAKKKKKSVPVTEQENGVESHIVLKSEVVSLETKETIETEKLPAKKGSKKQNKKKSISTVEETPIVQNVVEGGTVNELKAEIKTTQSRKKSKKLSVPVEDTVVPNEVVKESVDDIAVDQDKESDMKREEQVAPYESNKISEDKGEEDDKQGSKKRGKKGGKSVQTSKVEKEDESVEIEKPVLRRRSGKSSLMAELMEEALLGLDSELYQDELPVRTTRSKRSSQKQVGAGDAEKSQEMGEQEGVGEIPGDKDEEIVPRVTRRQNKKDVADVSEECAAEPKKSDEIEPSTELVLDTETTEQVVKNVNEPLNKRLPPAKSKKPGQKAGNKKKSLETAIDEDVNKVSVENSTDGKAGSIDATIEDVINKSVVPAGNVESLPNNEAETNDKNKKSKKRPSKKAESKVLADEIRPNIFYQRTSVTEVEPKAIETSKDADPCDEVTLPIEDPKPKKQVGKRVAKSTKAAEEVKESKDVDISEPEREEVTASSQIIAAAEQKSEVQDVKEAPSVSAETISRVPELPGNASEMKDVKPTEDKPSGGVVNSQQSTPQVKPSVPFKNKLLSGRLPSAEKAAALLSKKPLHQVDPPPLEEPKKRKIFSYQKKSAPARRLTRSNSNGKSDPKGEPAIDPYDYNEDEIVPFQDRGTNHTLRQNPFSTPHHPPSGGRGNERTVQTPQRSSFKLKSIRSLRRVDEPTSARRQTTKQRLCRPTTFQRPRPTIISRTRENRILLLRREAQVSTARNLK
uniref:Uncharacterized protein n=1 Tax=Lygus hesperus TaxID=30085 RepID=A0A0K8T556_LYGHE